MTTLENLQKVIDDFVIEGKKENCYLEYYYFYIKISLVDMFSELQKTMLPKPYHNFKMLTVTAKYHSGEKYISITLFNLHYYSTELDLLKKLNEYDWKGYLP